jgi:hypothetical protein
MPWPDVQHAINTQDYVMAEELLSFSEDLGAQVYRYA